jgi:hypothetical protein
VQWTVKFAALHLLFECSAGLWGDTKCFSPQDVEEARSPLVHDVESNEVIGLIPYLSPELIAAILKRESTSSVDSRADSKTAAENSFPALCSQSAVNEEPVRVPFRRKASWLRCSRVFAVVGRLVAPWFP